MSAPLTPPPLVGVSLKLFPEHIAGGIISSTLGFGLISTVTVNGSSSHEPSAPEVGIIVYITV